MNLRIKGYMLLGISRIALKKHGILLSDCQEIYHKLRAYAKDKTTSDIALFFDADQPATTYTTKETHCKKKVIANNAKLIE